MESSNIPNYPFCTTCKWANLPEQVWQGTCTNPRQGMNLVTGKPNEVSLYVHRRMLSLENYCGVSGRWWEEKSAPLDTNPHL